MPVGVADRCFVDVALGVVETEPGLGVVALDRADHFRGEQDVVDRHHFGEEIDAGLVVDAGVEENIVAQDLGELRLAVIERDAAKAAPMERHRAAAVRNDEFQLGERLEQVRQEHLHEHHGIGVEIIRAGGVHRRIAAARDVDHARHVELDHLLVQREPGFVGHRRRVEIAAGRIRIEVAADKTHVDAALELGGRVRRIGAR